MKSMVCRFGTALIVAAMLVPFTSLAQSVDPIHVNIPFDFVVRDHAMTAGDYKLTRISQGMPFWEIRGARGAVLFGAQLALDNKYSNPPRLRFHCYADECFLTEIHALGDWGLPRSGRQRQMAKNGRLEARDVALR